ncbi:MAG: hypothetical protein ACOH5I_07945 [Oligoflexus sp.]
MAKSAKDAGLRITVTLDLPADLTSFLRREQRGAHFESYESLVLEALRLKMDQQVKAPKRKSVRHSKVKNLLDKAPLDAFLPQGADPFTPLKSCQPDEIQVDFERIQSRLDTGRIPKILR